jgi:hypothetical protein
MPLTQEKKSPFATLTEEYKDKSGSITLHKALQALFQMFGIPTPVITSAFKRYIEEAVADVHPDYTCSAARSIVEGRIPGVPPLVHTIHPMWREQLEMALHLLDLFETLVQRHVVEMVRNADSSTRRDIKAIESIIGTNRSSALRNFLESAHAKQDKKAG